MEELSTAVVSRETSRSRGGHRVVETVEEIHSRYIIGEDAGDGEHEIGAPNPLCRCGETWMQLRLDGSRGLCRKHLGLSSDKRWQQGDGEEHDS